MFAVTLSAMSTVRNFPKLPVGWSMASMRPPTLPLSYPAFHVGTDGAARTTAAPRHCKEIYRETFKSRALGNRRKSRTIGMLNPR